MKISLNNNFKTTTNNLVEEVKAPKKLAFSNAGLWHIQNQTKTASSYRNRRVFIKINHLKKIISWTFKTHKAKCEKAC